MFDNYNTQSNQSHAEEVDASSVKCSGCGSNMLFNPETQSLVCPHCGSKQDFAMDTFAKEMDFKFW